MRIFAYLVLVLVVSSDIQADQTFKSEIKSEKKILKRFRATGGTTFPSIKESIPGRAFSEEKSRAIMRKQFNDQERLVAEQLKLPPIQKCQSARTEREAHDGSRKGQADFLFVLDPKQQIEKLYGERTIVGVYDPKKPDPLAYLARDIDVECLPFRVRVTDRFLFRHWGKDALLDYRDDPEGVGAETSEGN